MEAMTSRQRWLAALPSQPVDRLLDGRTQCPNKCLIGGTNAILWTKSSEEIIAAIERDLDALPHHRGIVVTSAGVMPPLCKPETIRDVSEWVKQYPARTLLKESPMTARSPRQRKTGESSFQPRSRQGRKEPLRSLRLCGLFSEEEI
ncbi:MAG: hypothetical protein AUJ92_19545 [Armatimonadetes bacterium CG2_30_59_28]|nr:hypothetical protein [Armatimonadota bacterium]OIO90121.1 MAG: hypothetical protein AUJ92_19545 [Armatimonadetes bacterium CG2_30_59_28]PIU66384.1 MAG: hypothetical protein COS85_05015 [Armatimonadetes bacterium CG07_land_8_20_14_0_80_59_28]PIX41603.1 MAG: hypothetical protein COZ56_11605 [Armatimonadetes bacterium CG_4_8_14_3_um_filter_58_9]PIY37937.1 MAG: hypothetical protein COZ05_21650 [Armatimonadetes bacterium CG_4_10_14_3_um_filter_59_10]PJB64213.1 MAG: hypothetical protein CO095_151